MDCAPNDAVRTHTSCPEGPAFQKLAHKIVFRHFTSIVKAGTVNEAGNNHFLQYVSI
jgi:hypothetical protein